MLTFDLLDDKEEAVEEEYHQADLDHDLTYVLRHALVKVALGTRATTHLVRIAAISTLGHFELLNVILGVFKLRLHELGVLVARGCPVHVVLVVQADDRQIHAMFVQLPVKSVGELDRLGIVLVSLLILVQLLSLVKRHLVCEVAGREVALGSHGQQRRRNWLQAKMRALNQAWVAQCVELVGLALQGVNTLHSDRVVNLRVRH